MTTYEVWLLRDDGTPLALLDNVGPFSYTLVVNNVGHFSVTLPSGIDTRLIAKDRRIRIWRKPDDGAMRLAFEGLIRRTKVTTSALGLTTRTVSGYDLTGLLKRRIVAFAAGSANAAMTDQADDMITEIVDDNFRTGASAARQISSTYMTIAASPAAGPSLTKGFAYRNVLDVLRDIADASRQAGTYLFFGIVPTGESTFEFRTRTGEWGRDRSSDSGNGLIFGMEFGNLSTPLLDEDATDEVNFAYGLGRGEEAARDVQTSEDTTRSGASIFARSEAAINAVLESTSAGVADVADGRVLKGRPLTLFTAKLLSVPGAVYGKDYDFGDRVTATYDGRQFDCLIRAVTVTVDENGAEDIDPIIEAIL